MNFEAIGTRWSIETAELIDATLQKDILDRIELFDKTYSRFRDDSLVSEIAKRAGTYELPEDSYSLVSFYRMMYELTNGAVTPLVGDRLEALGYDKEYSFKKSDDKTIGKWDEVMSWSGTTLTISTPLVLDFGAAGKGYLVDIISQMLEKNGISEYVVDASGDVRVRGGQEQVIGLEDPNNPARVIGAAKVKNASLCASATNRRRWGNNLHHLIDGRTGQPTSEIIATWVIADSTMVADGIATALFFAPAESLQSLGSFQFVRMFHDGKVEHSSDFVGELFI